MVKVPEIRHLRKNNPSWLFAALKSSFCPKFPVQNGFSVKSKLCCAEIWVSTKLTFVNSGCSRRDGRQVTAFRQ